MSKNKHELAKQFFANVFKVRRIVDKTFTLSGEASTILQMQALTYLEQYPQATVGELAQELYMSSPAIAQLTERLTQAKLIVRKNDRADRRVVRLSLSSQGKQELQTFPQVMQEKLGTLVQHIPEEDLRELNRIFTNLQQSIEDQKK